MKFLSKYLMIMLKQHIYFARIILRKLQNKVSANHACVIQNYLQILLRRQTRYGYDKEKILFFAMEDKNIHFFNEKLRGFSLYEKGLEERANKIYNSYLLDKVTFMHSDIIVDCGANYGDLYLALKRTISSGNYYSFEPGIKEFQSIELNAPKSHNFNLGLSNFCGETDFYMCSLSADSSIIKPKNYDTINKINTITLDYFMQEQKIQTVKLFKLEAEGLEPEILEGAENFIPICKFIAVDGGYERGEEQSETLSSIINKLTIRDFEVMGINLRMGRALFKNRN